ncbi:hypothetical protein KP509_29G079300 [Ceratopteris richardii]|uniref:Uncharacterized protein n=1 Tax=Ceratopteris richardii TaxID=49495 RepID=A0A8T2RA27_CERRI|nr:hypothetical protein KP509_29G079300 [Ceratopteris richardii]
MLAKKSESHHFLYWLWISHCPCLHVASLFSLYDLLERATPVYSHRHQVLHLSHLAHPRWTRLIFGAPLTILFLFPSAFFMILKDDETNGSICC